MRFRIPCITSILSEARLYAIESSGHTMDYEGWKDQHNKLERLTYGKYAQLWVGEFCRINGIDFVKDKSSPNEPDDNDLTICGHQIDVKSSVHPKLLGQISPGMYQRHNGFYCFILTDRQCSFVMPVGFIHCSLFLPFSQEVRKDQEIPGTNIVQRFGRSRFLQPGAPVVPFFDFMTDARAGEISNHISASKGSA